MAWDMRWALQLLPEEGMWLRIRGGEGGPQLSMLEPPVALSLLPAHGSPSTLTCLPRITWA